MNYMDEVVTRSAPRWAWDIIDETLSLDSESSSFSSDLRDDITSAMDAVTMSCEDPERETVSQDDLKQWIKQSTVAGMKA